MKRNASILFVAVLYSLLAFSNSASAQGTEFTYQGRLNAGGSPANGSYDIAFSLYGTTAGGVAIAGPVTNSAVAVTNGLFTTMVDLGNVFTGASNWLQIAVSTNGANAFSSLVPRQQLTPVPYAVYAESANATNLVGTIPAGNLSGAALLAGGNAFTGTQTINSGNVGIGTTTPAAPLDVTGTAAGVWAGTSVESSVFVRVDNTATDGGLFNSDVAGIGFGHDSTRQAIVGGTYGNDNLDFYTGGLLTAPKMRIDYNGNVGIGATTPAALLDVNGSGLFQGAVGITGSNTLQFGAGLAGQDPNAGKIGYEVLTSDSLDIVGAGTTNTPRKIKFWAEGGAAFSGTVTASSFAGDGGGLINLSAAQLTSIGNNNGGGDNFFVGPSGNATNSGSYNTATGYQALQSNTSGSYNTVNGEVALYHNTNGSFNTAIGKDALFFNTSGAHNIALGFQAGINISSGGGNIDIGSPGSTSDNNIIRIGTTQTATYLSGTVYANGVALTSDRNAKENFATLDAETVLARVASLPVTEWNYKAEDTEVRHLGPMAQDFHAAFGLNGSDDKHISMVDESGVALAAIQGLNQKLREELNHRDTELTELKAELSELRKMVNALNKIRSADEK
jgi:hypothetical protein